MFPEFFGGRPLFLGGSVAVVAGGREGSVGRVGGAFVSAFGAGGDLRFFGGAVGICSMDGVDEGARSLLGEGSAAIFVESCSVVWGRHPNFLLGFSKTAAISSIVMFSRLRLPKHLSDLFSSPQAAYLPNFPFRTIISLSWNKPKYCPPYRGRPPGL